MSTIRRPQQHVLVVGSLNIDLSVTTHRIPRGGETLMGSPLRTSAGGKSANQAVAAAALGAPVKLLGAVGDDAHGAEARMSVSARGVDTRLVRTVHGTPTGSALIVVDGNAENTIVVSPGANAELSPADVADDVVAQAGLVCLALESPAATVQHTAQLAARNGSMVVLNLSPYQPVPSGLLESTSLLIVNEHELASLIGASGADHDWSAIRGQLRELGISTSVVTLGPMGCMILDSGYTEAVPGLSIDAVDTTGSGDAFAGALAAGLAGGLGLRDAASLANAAGAYAATRPGAQDSYPSLLDLQRWIRQLASPAEGEELARIERMLRIITDLGASR